MIGLFYLYKYKEIKVEFIKCNYALLNPVNTVVYLLIIQLFIFKIARCVLY